jgi:hypothetical protein
LAQTHAMCICLNLKQKYLLWKTVLKRRILGGSFSAL